MAPRKESIPSASPPPGPPPEEEIWAQCEKCEKWRKLPKGTVVDESSSWFCEMNPVRARADCQVPEDDYDKTAEVNYVYVQNGLLELPKLEPLAAFTLDMDDKADMYDAGKARLALTRATKYHRILTKIADNFGLIEKPELGQPITMEHLRLPPVAWEAIFTLHPTLGHQAMAAIDRGSAVSYFGADSAQWLNIAQTAIYAAASNSLKILEQAAPGKLGSNKGGG